MATIPPIILIPIPSHNPPPALLKLAGGEPWVLASAPASVGEEGGKVGPAPSL